MDPAKAPCRHIENALLLLFHSVYQFIAAKIKIKLFPLS